jgi:transcriptional regulator NrdR family protein
VRIVPKLKKRSGKEEEFDRKKVEKSIKKAGVSENTARMIAEGVKHREGMATSEIRSHVIAELKRHEPEAARRYETHRK